MLLGLFLISILRTAFAIHLADIYAKNIEWVDTTVSNRDSYVL